MSDEISQSQDRGERRLLDWTKDGTLLSPSDFSARRGVGPIDAEDEAFAVWVEGQSWYPATLLEIAPSSNVVLGRALAGLTATDKLIFLLRSHGGLGGQTAAQAIAVGHLDRVVALAQAYGYG